MVEVNLRLRVTGQVQEGGYRGFVQTRARQLRLKGWVQNLDDGDVLIEVHGPDEQVEALIDLINVQHSIPKKTNIPMNPVS